MNKTSNSKAAEACLNILKEECKNWNDHCLVSLTLLCVAFVANDRTYEEAKDIILKMVERGIFEEAYNALKVDKQSE